MPAQQRKGNKAARSKAGSKFKGKGRQSKNEVVDVYEADYNESLSRKGHDLDEVDDFEYHAGEIKGSDDEEIDSDEAFDESDDERFDHFMFKGSTKPSEKKKLLKSAKRSLGSDDDVDEEEEQEIDLNESESDSDRDDEDEEELEDGEGFVDLSTMLDNNDEDQGAVVKQLMPQQAESEEETWHGFGDLAGTDAEESEAEEEDEDRMSEDEDEDEQDKKVVRFIDALETKKRKRGDDEDGKRKRPIAERTEAYQESEFNLPVRSSGTSAVKKKLDLGDLMDSMADEASFGTLRKSLEELEGKGKGVVKSALDAPLPKRIQDRLERQAAYKEATKEVSRWDTTVKQNREAEHLFFPLQAPPSEKLSNKVMGAKFEPQTDLEKQIHQALETAGMKDKEVEAFEALQLNKLSVEEVEARRAELQMMRELMFRHEIKAKRLKKIKSKSYRKLQRKEKARLELQANQLSNVDHEMSHEDQLKAAMDRAEERMTLKHKNTSKWAKRALARGQQDEGTREAIMEQLRRGEELRRKVQGLGSDDDSDAGSDQDQDLDSDNDVSNALSQMERELDEDTQPKKGLFQMKFMQDAEKRKEQANKAMLEEFKNEWLAPDSDDDQPAESQESNFSHVQNNPGRMAFGAKKNETKNSETEETTKSEKRSVGLNEAGQVKSVSHSASHNTRTSGPVNLKNKSPLAELDDDQAESNPWLQNDTSRLAKKASKSNKAINGKNETKSEQNISKIKKNKKEAQALQDTEDVEIDLSKALTVKSPAKKSEAKAVTVSVAENASDDDDESDDDKAVENAIVHSSKVAFSQRELVARAFANDNVVEEFEEEKRATIKQDDDKVEDMTLPGWGDWSGKGIKKRKRTRPELLKKTKGIKPEQRKDIKLANVIINEKRNKKVEKYQVTKVPFPFQNMEQYERSLRAPVGKEWNTRDTFQKMTKPRVMTKLGTVIDPLSAPFQ
ncbi:Utp14 protein-domain-containing protein [Radiomyces spectabilis]|uniref:Utp14 protein-domain-containing protein n=1 Tax=Radiomyces spectabilis TaxID=64574 RepID=UPI00221FE5C7|nr:Utp14 protein-domain-containing protein [Radiomyces spectabilis]KAI8379757.1 Utp14 protein-domain-containing protein [Radiomyces spectabilis]